LGVGEFGEGCWGWLVGGWAGYLGEKDLDGVESGEVSGWEC
jgi:hypothetical protein